MIFRLFTLRDLVFFLAGAMFLHTISHVIFPYFINLPFDMGFMKLTQLNNMIIIVCSAILTVFFLWLGSYLKR